jgi:hypothetical protein
LQWVISRKVLSYGNRLMGILVRSMLILGSNKMACKGWLAA